MMIYRSQEERADPRSLLASLQALLRAFEESGFASHDQARELLIEFGALEASAADALYRDLDSDTPLLRQLRQAALLTGDLFCKSRRGEAGGIGPACRRLGEALDRLGSLPLPGSVAVRLPEGYAYYALYPESYLEAAVRFFSEVRPRRAVCIGVRSIGTSLSAVVAAALERLGCKVASYTVRPRGHPFQRTLSLSAALEAALRRSAGSHFLIVDEGPGLSGSSFAAVAGRLAGLGVPDDRIFLFPSWEPDGNGFLSGEARERWRRHRKYAVPFEALWTENRRLIASLPDGALTDLSAGRWRALFYADESNAPAVHPQHERRKYLCSRSAGGEPPLLIKFAGLGRCGRMKLERAGLLADGRFAPRPLGLENGFLIAPFVPGEPLSRESIVPGLLDAMADYLAYRRERFSGTRSVPFDAMMEMIRVNTEEGLGEEWAARLVPLKKARPFYEGLPPAAIDGRMLPHKWLRTKEGYLKMDGVDHDRDHFFPGAQDLAWDLAGASVEFALGREAERRLVERYQARSGDKGMMKRLPFYTIAYLAFRLGYAAFAADGLGPTPDGKKFRLLADRYASSLRREISRLPDGV